MQFIQDEIKKLIHLLCQVQQDDHLLKTVDAIAATCVKQLRNKNKILFAGNGGSAADAQHLAAELVSRLHYDRPGLAAIALTTDTSALTAIGNDYHFEQIFARQIASLGQPGDIFFAISTSGKSPNILAALKAARQQEMITIGFTSTKQQLMHSLCDHVVTIPSSDTQKIQECHILFGHIICGMIEEAMFGEKYNPMRHFQQVVV